MYNFINNIRKNNMKSNKLPSVLVLVFITFMSQMSFALSREDVSSKLDHLVLHENIFNRMTRVTAYFMKANVAEGSIKTKFDLAQDEEAKIQASWSKESRFDLVAGIGRFEEDDEAVEKFDLSAGTFTKTYIYLNLVSHRIKMSFVLTSDAIKRIDCTLAPAPAPAPAHALAVAVSSSLPAAPMVDPSPLVMVAEPTPFVAASVEVEDSTVCVSTPVIAASVEKFQGTLSKLEFLSNFSKEILRASGEFDHIYSAGYFAAVGACNFVEGLMSWNPLAAAHGAVQLAVAAKSGTRVYEGYKEDASQLLGEIQESAGQINDLSTATTELVATISKNLASVRTKLVLVQSEYDKAKEIFERASIDQTAAMSRVLAKYEEAREEAKRANEAFTKLSVSSGEIQLQWQEIGDQLALLEKNFTSEITDAAKMKFYLMGMEEIVTSMRSKFTALSEHFQIQAVLSEEVTKHRDAQDRLTSEASKMLLDIIRAGVEANESLRLAFSDISKRFSEADQLIKSQEKELERCRQQSIEVAALSAVIKSDATKVQKKLDQMYTAREIALATCVAVVCPGGALVCAAAGLTTLTVVHGRLGR